MDSITPTELFELWLAGGEIPPAERFHPSPDEPVKTVSIGQIDGTPLYAYGVQTVFVGMSGMPMREVRVYNWKWLLDRDAALLEANTRLFTESREAGEWLSRDVTDVSRVESRQVTPKVGSPFQIFRVAGQHGLFFGFVWKLCSADQVCAILHQTLLEKKCDSRERFAFAPRLNARTMTTVPEIVEERFATCSHCSSELIRYGTLQQSGSFDNMRQSWFLDRAQAETEHAKVVELVTDLRAEDRRRHDNEVMGQITGEIWRASHTLCSSARYQTHKAAVDPALIEQFETASYDASQSEGDIDLFDALEQMTKAVEAVIAAEETRVNSEIESNGLVARLKVLLDTHLPNCPVCRVPYNRDEAFMTELLVHGRGRPACGCPDRYERGKEPALLTEIEALRFSIPEDARLAGLSFGEVEILRVQMSDTPIVRLTAGIYRPATIMVDRAALLKATGTAKLVNVWEATARQARANQAANMERQVSEGHTLKLLLRRDERRGSWSDRWRDGGVTTVYAVRRESESEVTGPGWYYCSPVAEPRGAQKPDFRFVLVSPIRRVPEEYIPRR